jgi:hypothetical protein
MPSVTRLLLLLSLAACAPKAPLPDPPEVGLHRQRIGLLQDAIAQTRATIAASQDADYLPELYLRLAELRSEEARYHYLVAEARADGSDELHVPHVRALEEEAVTLYRTVTARFPDSPLAPQAQFLAAHGLRELGEHDAAMVELRELVGAWPDSVYRHE